MSFSLSNPVVGNSPQTGADVTECHRSAASKKFFKEECGALERLPHSSNRRTSDDSSGIFFPAIFPSICPDRGESCRRRDKASEVLDEVRTSRRCRFVVFRRQNASSGDAFFETRMAADSVVHSTGIETAAASCNQSLPAESKWRREKTPAHSVSALLGRTAGCRSANVKRLFMGTSKNFRK